MRHRELIRDFWGVAASQQRTSLVRDTPASILIALATLGSYVKTTRDFVVDSIGIPGAFVPTIVAIAGFVACLVVISSKKKVRTNAGFCVDGETLEYSFGKWTRHLARVACVALAFVIPYDARASIQEALPLPLFVSGVVFDAKTAAPIEGARLRIVTADGVDVTKPGSNTETDSNGVFSISMKQRVRRNATISIYRNGCKPATAALWKRFEAPIPSSLPYVEVSESPFFSFYVECQE